MNIWILCQNHHAFGKIIVIFDFEKRFGTNFIDLYLLAMSYWLNCGWFLNKKRNKMSKKAIVSIFQDEW